MSDAVWLIAIIVGLMFLLTNLVPPAEFCFGVAAGYALRTVMHEKRAR